MAARSSPGVAAPSTLEDLPLEVLQEIVSSRGLLGIQDVRLLRLAARWLRKHASHAVHTLLARDGGQLAVARRGLGRLPCCTSISAARATRRTRVRWQSGCAAWRGRCPGAWSALRSGVQQLEWPCAAPSSHSSSRAQQACSS
jgi:hypothetical protein